METAKITITPQHHWNDDKIELEVKNGFEIKVENGKYYVVNNKPQYPKDYEECCEVLNTHVSNVTRPIGWKENLISKLQKLIICRDAYWKIAGEEMELDKPWEPDWDNLSTNHKFIKIGKGCFFYSSRVLVFPTKKNARCFL